MDPAWTNGLIGGLLIGSAAAIHMLFNGRIAGMTGMIASALRLVGGERDEGARLSAAFIAGAIGAAAGLTLAVGAPEIVVTRAPWALILSGLIVGVGVTFSNGCTSGHGVVGMSRFSKRSIAATLTFMATTAITVAVIRHGLGITL
ncbi:MAG: YeeE/YedE family protein [Rhodobacteraceae bacterium]|nr:MAG: YeeE/YedE family protein [Paracoccaceae bacterium]